MKTRATSFALAALAVVSLVLPALAVEPDELPEETAAKSEEIEEVRKAVLLDGEPAETVEFEIVDGVCYVTVGSFVSLMDAEAMVEEEDGIVSVNASTVIEVVAVDEVSEEAEPIEGSETEAAESVEAAANVVTADLNLTAAAGGSYVVANGRYLYARDGVMELNGRVAVPVRLLARVYNLDVDYEAENELVMLSHQEGVEPYLADAGTIYNEDVLYWLSHIIYAESGNQPLEGKIAVGNVVLNRVASSKFPNTVYEVIFQRNQFTPVSNGTIYATPTEECVIAAKLCLDGANTAGNALYFINPRYSPNSWASRNRPYVATIGAHAFYA